MATESTYIPDTLMEYDHNPVTFKSGGAIKPGQDLKITADMTMSIASGLDTAHGKALGYAKAGEDVGVAHHFRGGIYNSIVKNATITAGNYVKPTGTIDTETGLPEYEPEGTEKTRFVAVTGGLLNSKILIGVL